MGRWSTNGGRALMATTESEQKKMEDPVGSLCLNISWWGWRKNAWLLIIFIFYYLIINIRILMRIVNHLK